MGSRGPSDFRNRFLFHLPLTSYSLRKTSISGGLLMLPSSSRGRSAPPESFGILVDQLFSFCTYSGTYMDPDQTKPNVFGGGGDSLHIYSFIWVEGRFSKISSSGQNLRVQTEGVGNHIFCSPGWRRRTRTPRTGEVGLDTDSTITGLTGGQRDQNTEEGRQEPGGT